jgi:hypothetical protein
MLEYAALKQYIPIEMRKTSTLTAEFLEEEEPKFKPLTAVFLDTTYCDPNYAFAKQADVISCIAQAVQRKQGPKVLFLVGTYSIGKERICKEIAKVCKCKIFVTFQK